MEETIFTSNNAPYGGAIEALNHCYVRVIDCTFKDNLAQVTAGAIRATSSVTLEINTTYYLENGAILATGAILVEKQSRLFLINCTFCDNFSKDVAGAIDVRLNSTAEIRHNNFTKNRAHEGGALMATDKGNILIMHCTFQSNKANNSGGVALISEESSLEIRETNLTDNSAVKGAAISIEENCKLHTTGCRYWKNEASQDGGAIVVHSNAEAYIENCLFLSNRARYGGAVVLSNPRYVSLTGTVFEENIASKSGGAVGIKFVNGQTNVIVDNITCIGNEASSGGCLVVESAILTLINSSINENCGSESGAALTLKNSRMQVCTNS